MPIRSFGIFSSVMILVCALIQIIIQPISYFTYEKHIKNIFWEDKRLNFSMVFGNAQSDTGHAANVNDKTGFKTLPPNDKSINYDDFIQ